MDPRFQSSFIPKKPVVTSMRPKHGPINLLSLVSTVVFILALALALGVFLYQSYLNNGITSDEQSLNLAQGQFDTTTINSIIRLDTRLNVANSLLSKHTEISNLFRLLENITLQTVRFNNFSLMTGDQNILTLNMKGEAMGFSDVAQQSSAFNKSAYFGNLVVSGLSLEQNGAVAFSMTSTVNPSLVVYAPSTSVVTNTIVSPIANASSTISSVATTTASSSNSTKK